MTDLSKIILARCEQDQLPLDHSLRKLAISFNDAVDAVVKEPVLENSKKMIGAWAKLRKEWGAYSGEPIL